jgi:hypothetical protein
MVMHSVTVGCDCPFCAAGIPVRKVPLLEVRDVDTDRRLYIEISPLKRALIQKLVDNDKLKAAQRLEHAAIRKMRRRRKGKP